MKSSFYRCLALGLLFIAPLFAQDDPPTSAPLTAPADLDQALGPIALYPDALIALILPASTDPSDVVLAARYLQDGGDPADTDDQPWDDSLKALVRYPEVVKWMDQNLAWTKQVGEAFLNQPDGVMNSIQHLRAEARASGALTNTPQQEIVTDGANISIMPAQPDVIYVPDYDPDVVYVSQPGYSSDPFMTFGVGYPTGFWLGYDLDWGHRRIWTVDPRDRERYWSDHRDWRHPSFPGRPDYVRDPSRHPWKPAPGYQRPPNPPANRPDAQRPPVQRPAPFPNGAPRSNDPRRNEPDRTPGNRDQGPTPNRRPEGRPSDSPRPAPPVPQPQAQPGRQPVPERGPQPTPDNRGRDNRDNSGRPPVVAQPRQPPPAPPRQPPPPTAQGPARDDKADNDKQH
jgi:hypothetical protein